MSDVTLTNRLITFLLNKLSNCYQLSGFDDGDDDDGDGYDDDNGVDDDDDYNGDDDDDRD